MHDLYEDEELISFEEQAADGWQYSLRPRRLNEYIGQDKVKSNLSKFIQAALSRGEALDHVLLYGPPGLGKTTLAAIIANEMGANFRQTSAPAIERQGDLASLLTNLQTNDILFIDEIHRLSHHVEEILYSAMEDHAIDIIIGKGPSARSLAQRPRQERFLRRCAIGLASSHGWNIIRRKHCCSSLNEQLRFFLSISNARGRWRLLGVRAEHLVLRTAS